MRPVSLGKVSSNYRSYCPMAKLLLIIISSGLASAGK